MLKIKKSKSLGIAPLFIIIGVVVVIIIGVVIFNAVKKSPSEEQLVQNQTVEPVKEKMPGPIYEAIVENVKFKLVTAEDIGNTLKCEERINPYTECLPQYNFDTTDKFIKVDLTAQNMGQDNIPEGSWRVEEMFDSEGRKFYSPPASYDWISKESKCGNLLKPYFEPTTCIKIYEVSKHSIGLKVKIYASPTEEKRIEPQKEYFIDLNLYNEKYCWDDSDCACGINKYTKDCFLGNKTYVDFSGSPTYTYTPDIIEKCDKFCATATTEGPTVKCVSNECK